MTKMTMHVSGIDQLSAKTRSILEGLVQIEYKLLSTKTQLINSLKTCDIFWFRLNHKLSRDVLKDSKCSYILCAVTGLDHIDLKACKDFGISVISLKGEHEFLKNIRATAEHTFGLMLALIRNSKAAFNHVDKGNWDRTRFKGYELYDKRIGIFGFGRLGKIVADYAKAFGMKVYFFDIEERAHDDEFIKCNSKEELIASSDILTIHLPYNDENHFIINFELLDTITTPIYIINTSRGALVNEKDLLHFIKLKKVYGYATDVLFEEPDVTHNVLQNASITNENIIITPHIGGNTYESIENTENFIANKLRTLLKTKI